MLPFPSRLTEPEMLMDAGQVAFWAICTAPRTASEGRLGTCEGQKEQAWGRLLLIPFPPLANLCERARGREQRAVVHARQRTPLQTELRAAR